MWNPHFIWQFQSFLFQSRTAPIPWIVFVPIQLKSNSIKFPFSLNRVQSNSVASITGKLKQKNSSKLHFTFYLCPYKDPRDIVVSLQFSLFLMFPIDLIVWMIWWPCRSVPTFVFTATMCMCCYTVFVKANFPKYLNFILWLEMARPMVAESGVADTHFLVSEPQEGRTYLS